MNTTEKRIKLDWNKLIGFDQAKAVTTDPSVKRTKSMIGGKLMAGIKVS
jgi:hypothetical protein